MSSPATGLPARAEDSGAVALAAESIVAGYGQVTVLRDVSIRVEPATATGLLGPNGAGKSTLLKVLTGLIRPSSGRVWLLGKDVTGHGADRRAQSGLCLIPEGRGVFRSLTVRENLLMQVVGGGDTQPIELATSTFPILGKRLSQQAGTLSGGEQQMLALAAAYLRNPKVVLVDECSLGLAPVIVDVVFEFLQARKADGVAILIVDQYVHRVLELAPTTYVMRRGQIVYCGPSADLRDGRIFERYIGTEA
jgi:branched-chain amino acid transport system ATP-binding protein